MITLVKSITFILAVSISALISAHPEDEFCEGGDMDPILCAQLSELDRPASSSTSSLPEIKLERSPLETGLLYTKLGVEHILPLGLDHLAFLLALLLSASALKPLLIQISLFTLAHSVTLILGVLDILVLQAKWVEVAIAASIVFIALENIFLRNLKLWRLLIIFCFGLLHGLGFAGALAELGIPSKHFICALIGFNLGVEIGQLSFATAVFLFLFRFSSKRWYKKAIALPGSLFVAFVGAFWLIERLL